MATRAGSSILNAATSKLTPSDSTRKSTLSTPAGLVPLPAKPTFESSGLKSRKPVPTRSSSSPSSSATDVHYLESAITKVGEDIATTSEEILDAVDSVISEEGLTRGRRRKGISRMNRRRALIMCLALGMVRPCASTGESSAQDLRRTVSEFPIARTTSMSPGEGSSGLFSQVSLATSLKQTNMFGQKEDLQKLTTLQ